LDAEPAPERHGTTEPNLLMSRRERQRRRTRHRGHPLRRSVLLTITLVISGAAIAALVGVGWVVSVADSAPNLRSLTPHAPNPPSAVFASDGTLLGYIHSSTIVDRVNGNQIPPLLKDATVAIEDRRFFHHGALDYQGIVRAGIRDVFSGHNSLQGASTLTMQLVDNDYLPSSIGAHHNLKYKIVQAKLAQQLESFHSKMWILNTYLNDVPYGTVGGVTAIGVGAAAQMFFNKSLQQLTLADDALLAGLPQAPSDYNPFLSPHLALQRRSEVLQAMVQSRYITQQQADEAARSPLQIQTTTVYNIHRQPYVFDYIQQQLIQKLGVHTVENGGLKVYTTINLKMQQQAQNAIMNNQPGGPNLDAQPAAALATVDPSNGHVLALAQSASYAQTKFDYPVQAERQTGSAFKVFALMTLIHDYHGDPNQTYYTSQFLPAGWLPEDPTWSVHTAEDSYEGTIDVNHATVVSDNTVFAQLAADLGWDKLDRTAHAMGITSELTANPAEVIGGLKDCCTMLEMADAYATLSSGGVHHPATILDHVVFPDGSVANLGDPPSDRVFSYGEAYAATQVLKGVIQSGTGTAANYGCPAAGKTGTAENMDNAWFVGYTPKLATAVWVGYPQGNVPMGDGFGGTLAAPIWHDFMDVASDGYCGDWSQPNDPFSGTAFSGPHSAASGQTYGNSRNSNGSNSSGNGGGNGGGVTYTNPYNNPALYAQPTQPGPGPAPAGGGGGGTGGGGGGTGGGGTGGGGIGGGTGGGGAGGGGGGHSGGGHHGGGRKG
jgi:penicillin-binding protein 1A